MALKRPKGPAGTLVVLEHTSEILKGNPLGDPHVRKLGVWLPPQYDGFRGRRCFPALGGNQYVNSPAIGDYADYLTREIIPFVEREFRTDAGREHRDCFGKSSGGYGAIIHGMKYAKYWGAIADHSGDA